jgi:hypothetical protein
MSFVPSVSSSVAPVLSLVFPAPAAEAPSDARLMEGGSSVSRRPAKQILVNQYAIANRIKNQNILTALHGTLDIIDLPNYIKPTWPDRGHTESFSFDKPDDNWQFEHLHLSVRHSLYRFVHYTKFQILLDHF